jgi:hypothetical protein
MSVPNYSRFLSDCFIQDPERQSGLPEDEIYGAYLSWCLLNGEKPGTNKSLWAEMRQQGHSPQQQAAGQYIWAGLTLTGPAAVDYILSSQPSLSGSGGTQGIPALLNSVPEEPPAQPVNAEL